MNRDWADEEKLFGPCQLNDAPEGADADKLSAVPSQSVVLPEMVGTAGIELITACRLAGGLLQPLTVTMTE